MERKNLQQLLASAQQELNRLTTKQKNLTRKETTHKKIVLGGEVAKYMGLDIDQNILVGFLLTFASSTDVQRNTWLSNGVRARQLDDLRKEQKNKNYIKKRNTEKPGSEVKQEEDIGSVQPDTVKDDTNNGKPLLEYNNFSKMLEKGLMKKKKNNE